MTPHMAPTPRDVALVLILGVFCTALAHTLFIASMRRMSAQTASIVSILEPVYGIALAALLLGEVPGLRTLIGGGLIVSAAALATRDAMARSTAIR
jgi:drug/metabolite transporter (DMT)-like permease